MNSPAGETSPRPLRLPPPPAMPATPLGLLFRVNLMQALRRFNSLRAQSPLFTAVILAFVGGYFVLAFEIFYQGMRFLSTFPGLGEVLIERLLYILFAFLFAMLLLSNMVIGYTNLFRNKETSHLFTLPIPARVIFQWKFVETMLLASWAFVFLVSPLMLAFGLVRRAEWHFYAVTPLLVAVFIVLPAALGLWMAINLARYVDRRGFQVLVVGGTVLLLAGAAFYFRPQPIPEDETETRVLAVVDKLLDRTKFSQFALLPSHWISTSMRHWSEGAVSSAAFFVLVMLSNMMLFGFVAMTRLGKPFYDAASMVQSRPSVFGRWGWFKRRSRKRREFHYRPGAAEKFFDCLRWLPAETRSVLVKDVRIFWRDTAQWGQTAVLFGLLGFYIINLRHFMQELNSPFWLGMVSYLNLAACSLNLATLTTRFVYPQFSLEGRRLWIVGIAPIGLPRLMRIKMWLSTTATMIVTLGLIWLSCHLIMLPWERTLFYSVAVAVMTFTLNGMAAGLGALYPNMREDNPGKIVSGFGGTLCLVLSFLYIFVAILLLALASPWWNLSRGWQFAIASVIERVTGTMGLNDGLGIEVDPSSIPLVVWVGFLLLSVASGWVPFRLGQRRMARYEF